MNGDLELAFDVGHSSIGWAVLQRRTGVAPVSDQQATGAPPVNVLGCGAVTFGADDCLASKRRLFRRQRRHARSTRQRIERMEKLLLHLGVLTREQLAKKHTQAGGHPAPWLLAARVLASNGDSKYLLDWPELWDVLRWYAHNRGYDGNRRWSSGTQLEAMSDTPQISQEELDQQVKDSKEAAQDTDEDWKKLQAAAERISDYGFTSPTFAEMIAKFLLGPERIVKMGGEGKPGIVEPSSNGFSEDRFHKLLFENKSADKPHSFPLKNYFKGLRATFPRRVVKAINGKATLVAGTEWEVRKLLRMHFKHLPHCDQNFEKALCGGIPEQDTDWRTYETIHPSLYLDKAEEAEIRKLKISRKLSREEKEHRKQERVKLLNGKLVIPDRYQGGLLFGQIVPRFDNRIIEQCPVTFAEEFNRFIKEDYSEQKAKHKAGVLAKVPGKNCYEFLDFRWAMILANIQIGFGSEKYKNREGKDSGLRFLSAEERRKIDARVRKLGFLKVEPDKEDKNGHTRKGKNDLLDIVSEETRCDRSNLEALLHDPNAKDGLKLLPVEGDVTAFRIAWAFFDDPGYDPDGKYRDSHLRRRFVTQLLRQRRLSLNEVIKQLRHLGEAEIAEQINDTAIREASDRRGRVNDGKLGKLMTSQFFCPKISGRARFSRKKLREAFQEVFRQEEPRHPLEKGGCLEYTEEIKQVAFERNLDEMTNNHLVRHRLKVLTSGPEAKRRRKPSELKPGLLEDIIEEFAQGDKKRISRITVELARDLQEMSGMTQEEKKTATGKKLANHQKVSDELAKALCDANGNPLRDQNGKPFAASAGLIRKARILHDLNKRCPFTGEIIEFTHLVKPHPRFGKLDKDHVIPRSQRLSDALEAQVVTFSEINQLKDQRTAIQFIRDMNLPENAHHKDRFGIRTEAQFREFVSSLQPKTDPFRRARAGGKKVTDDEARCWKRKQLLLRETWDEKDFTPADLAKTRYIVKLAAQKLENGFSEFPKEERPAIISIPGAVTAAFRDKTWKLLDELQAIHPAVKVAFERAEKELGFNPKKAVRNITHLHHAVDSIALALIAHKLVPQKHQSLDGELVRLIVKGKPTVDKEKGIDELSKFRAICAKLCLPKFAKLDGKNRLFIEPLEEPLKGQIRRRLAEKRIVRHIPSDMSGLGGRLRQNTTGILKVFSPIGELLWKLNKNSEGELEKLREKILQSEDRDRYRLELTSPKGEGESDEFKGKSLIRPVSHVLGFLPENGKGKLKTQRGVREIRDNYGLAILDHAKNPGDRFVIIPWHKIWHKIAELKVKNEGRKLKIIRRGDLISFEEKGAKRVVRIFGAGQRKRGIYLDAGEVDALSRQFELNPKTLLKKQMRILGTSLTGVAAE